MRHINDGELYGLQITNTIVPCTENDKYATHDSQYGRGGWHEVATMAEMKAIPAERRRDGMACWVKETKSLYVLQGFAWEIFAGVDNELIKEIVEKAIENGDLTIDVDLTEYVKTEDFNNALAEYKKAEEVTADIEAAKEEIKTWVGEQGFATGGEVPENVATKEDVATGIAEAKAYTDEKTQGVATEDFVVQKVAEAQLGGEVDLSAYALKTDLDPYATTEYVDTAIAGIEIPEVPEVDLSEYAKTADVETELTNYAVKTDVEASVTEINTAIETLDTKAVKWSDFIYQAEKRNTIQLPNYDSLSGVGTDGNGYNLVMVSKWNVADFGSPSIHTNINTADILTINDKQAVVTDQLMSKILVSGENTSITPTQVTDEATGFKYYQYTVSTDVDLSSYATKEELREATKDIASNETITNIQADITKLTEDNTTLQAAVTELTEENTTLQASITSITEENEALKAKIAELEASNIYETKEDGTVVTVKEKLQHVIAALSSDYVIYGVEEV